MSGEAGVRDSSSANSKSQGAESAASKLKGLAQDFESAMDSAASAVGESPGVTGYKKYKKDAADSMVDVEEYMTQAAINAQSASNAISKTDDGSSDDYASSTPPLSRGINFA